MGNLNHCSLSQSLLACRMKTSVVINGMSAVIKAFVEARTRIQNDLELEKRTGKNKNKNKNKMLFNKGQVQDCAVQWV